MTTKPTPPTYNPQLPDWVAPSEPAPSVPSAPSDSKTPPVSRTNATQRPIEQQIRTVAADLRKLGPVYGTTKLGGRVDIIEEIDGYLYLRALFCIGEISQVQSVEINGKTYLTGDPTGDPNYQGDWEDSGLWTGGHALPYSASAGEIYLYGGSYYELKSDLLIVGYTGSDTPTIAYAAYFDDLIVNAEVNTYVGSTSQGVDPLLAAAGGALAGYAETLTGTWNGTDYGIAYAVLKIKLESYEGGFPRVTAVLDGNLLYDPETATTAFSKNPALALRDFLVSPLYGRGAAVAESTVKAAKDYCDAAFPDGPRIELNLAIAPTKPEATQNWVETLRAYAHVWLDFQDGEYRFILDAAEASAGDIVFHDPDLASPEFAAMPDLEAIPASRRPNDVTVAYTGADWKTAKVYSKTAGLIAETEPPVATEISMPGITVEEQAQRYADYRRKVWEQETFMANFSLFDPGLNINPGEVRELTCEPIGLAGVPVRIVRRQATALGDYAFLAQAYSADVYEDP